MDTNMKIFTNLLIDLNTYVATSNLTKEIYIIRRKNFLKYLQKVVFSPEASPTQLTQYFRFTGNFETDRSVVVDKSKSTKN